MSGLVGMVNFDGAPADARLLGAMTQALDFRGPDGSDAWCEGPAGLGHTLLRTTYEAGNEAQPLSFDGKTWIVADARIDAREDLVAKLKARGRSADLARPDVELILHAWYAWGEACVEHLLGDFAFAVWDAGQRRLFCARDHVGIKPFYYAEVGRTVVFSNTLDVLRLHPGVGDDLNELAIADFLLFGVNQDKATTSYADIQRIPPAHRRSWSAAGPAMRRYWTLPIDEPVYRRKPSDYTDEFSALLTLAVGDRLRWPRVGVLMSGGLDSTTLAAEARDQLGRDVEPAPVHAFTTLTGPDDPERRFAGLAADQLGIGVTYRQRRGAPSGQAHIAGPEPETTDTEPAAWQAEFDRMAAFSRVAFYGEGPDNALGYEWRAHIAHLLRRRRFARLAVDVASDRIANWRVPGLASLRLAAGHGALPAYLDHVYPSVLNPDLETRLGLRARWESVESPARGVHPTRPSSYRSFDLTLWQSMFESQDCATTRAPLEVRHPFLDLRLLAFMLSVPAVPWCRRKFLIRQAMRGRLPEAVLQRDKSPLPPHLSVADPTRLPSMELAPEAREFLKSEVENPAEIADPQMKLRVGMLSLWVRGRSLPWVPNL